jgi:hypothetical protein
MNSQSNGTAIEYWPCRFRDALQKIATAGVDILAIADR